MIKEKNYKQSFSDFYLLFKKRSHSFIYELWEDELCMILLFLI